MAVTRMPAKKAMRTKMTNSEVVKEVVQEVQAELSTGLVVVTLPSLCCSTVSLYAETVLFRISISRFFLSFSFLSILTLAVRLLKTHNYIHYISKVNVIECIYLR